MRNEAGQSGAKETAPIAWEQGTIVAANGANSASDTRIRTVDKLPLTAFSAVTVADDLALTWFAYDAAMQYLGNGTSTLTANWLSGGIGVTTETIRQYYEDAQYFRLAIKRTDGSSL